MRRLLPLLLLTSCTKATLVPAPQPDPAKRDDRVSMEGDFCTTDPETLNFPVKLLFIVDRSQSMNVSDPNDDRVRGMLDAISTLGATPGVEFGIVGFGLSTTPETERCESLTPRTNCVPGFTDSVEVARNGALRTGNPGAGNTDFGAALSTAYTMLFRDMSLLDEQDAGNARYVIIFFSDGLADLDAAATQEGESINDLIDNIVELKKRFRLREVQFNTALLSGGINRADIREQARNVMIQMARRGGGVFRDFANGGEINFLAFDVTSYRRLYTLKSLLVANLNARPSTGDEVVDSDGDGLTDAEEDAIGSDPLKVDTDDDFFNDLLEHRLRTSGLDPLDPVDGDCALDVDQVDSDGDGLRDCEERFLGTRPKRVDTDFDGVPDTVEIWFDTLSSVDDLAQDLDFDGSLNGDEIRWHSNPRSNDSARLSDQGYRYVVQDQGLQGTRFCYHFNVGNIRLASTDAPEGERPGLNRIFVYITEVPLDDPGDVAQYRVGCVTARYIAEQDYKDPPDGKLTLTEADLYDPLAFDPEQHCRGR
ncbi:MAG: VWA domain-containing protein [Myxococcota bacterium]